MTAKRYYRIQYTSGIAYNVPAERLQAETRFSLSELAAIREIKRNHGLKLADVEITWFENNVP